MCVYMWCFGETLFKFNSVVKTLTFPLTFFLKKMHSVVEYKLDSNQRV